MPGFSGLSNQSCERRFLPLGCGVAGSFPDAVLPFFFAISSSPEASFRRVWNRLISARECAQVRRKRTGACGRSRWSAPENMFIQLLAGGLVSFLNFGIHALITGAIVLATGRMA